MKSKYIGFWLLLCCGYTAGIWAKDCPSSERGRVLIKTTPAAVQILLQEKEIVSAGTPAMTPLLCPGNYVLQISAKGYYTKKVAIEVHADVLETKTVELGLTVPMPMVRIPKGCFQMGSERVYKDEKPVHRVCLQQDYWLGAYEVTQGQWQAVMGSNPSKFKKGDNYPVEGVSWDDVQQFIAKLNRRSGLHYRLPTEAEWEYAARAGTKTAYWWGDKIGKNNAHCNGCGSRWDYKQTVPVGSFKKNPWGLYDMHGNVWEWNEDIWHGNYKGAPKDGSAWLGNSARRVVRGGSWISYPRHVRAASRRRYEPGSRSYLGFRLVLGSVGQ